MCSSDLRHNGLPVWLGVLPGGAGIVLHGAHNEDEYLAACYWNSMALAYEYMRKNDMESINIAFPCISTGINAYPNHEACVIAIQTVKRLMNKFPETRAIHVCFVCDKTEDYMLYKEALKLR